MQGVTPAASVVRGVVVCNVQVLLLGNVVGLALLSVAAMACPLYSTHGCAARTSVVTYCWGTRLSQHSTAHACISGCICICRCVHLLLGLLLTLLSCNY